jgi:hypothetical protein
MSHTNQHPQGSSRRLVIVSGSGRSGTSTVAGTLKLLGLAVPQPEVKADSTNPRGFFEPRWVVDFHKEWLRRADVRTLDARPEAAGIVAKAVAKPQPRDRLTHWLAGQFSQPQVVVKDPRTFWFRELWHHAADAVGADVAYLTMLRHPAEVIGSRDTHYLKGMSAEDRLARETGHLAGWVNVVLVNELTSRSGKRIFVQYPDLLESWRSTMAGVEEGLGLSFTDINSLNQHPVDDFIDSDLRRVRLTWDDLDVPGHLRDLADQAWEGLLTLCHDPTDPAAMATLDEVRSAYHKVHSQALAMTHDATVSAIRRARQQTRRRVLQEMAEQAKDTSQPLAKVRHRAMRALWRS